MNSKHISLLHRIGYFFLLITVSSFILVVFLKPSESHSGINEYNRSKFMDMVEGEAHKPFVYRTLLPTTIRVVSSLTPKEVQETFSVGVDQNLFLGRVFNKLLWEPSAAYQYFIASILMLACLIGFAHYSTALTIKVCGLKDTYNTRSLLATIILI